VNDKSGSLVGKAGKYKQMLFNDGSATSEQYMIIHDMLTFTQSTKQEQQDFTILQTIEKVNSADALSMVQCIIAT